MFTLILPSHCQLLLLKITSLLNVHTYYDRITEFVRMSGFGSSVQIYILQCSDLSHFRLTSRAAAVNKDSALLETVAMEPGGVHSRIRTGI